mmetsp:Transcript_33226/g.48788  ORF Transcript_33226/g.48788 Transcript_33226/m.48788 type:complete len:514 (+) Transcript_33226:88-1629(+)|eukprot:CAMPEP_0195520822 /NCGR_PEP_ID=MMETSP0794_2-20130614/17561_1 /TAXON_ID=515487 /ORGANISM="Stephanopyxis turris, Strain CCMP 815" /LENGTH=513 /DNA_ID=CAMNT_0040650249 /DNA_START=46 /DNA_END=1587 /DNA_ORIENTATION=-
MEEGSRQNLSAAALNNNIGALLFNKDQLEDSTTYLNAAIEATQTEDHCESKRAGLAWFLRKLERDHDPNPRDRRLNLARSASADRRESLTRTCSRRGCIVEDIAPVEVCCDENTPLGLEYFIEPIFVEAACQDEDVVASARLNLCLMQYQNAKTDADLQQLMDKLRDVQPTTSFLRTVKYSNIGVVLFRLSDIKGALSSFENANTSRYDFIIQNSREIEQITEIHRQYINMAVLLNHARCCVRLNQITEVPEMTAEIALLLESVNQNSKYLSLRNRMRWIKTLSELYIMGLVHHKLGELEKSLTCFTNLLRKTRHDLGHSHTYVATTLFLKGMVLFDQRKLHLAMLSQLACLRIYEIHDSPDLKEMAQVMYSVARTLHDREDYGDALNMYQRTVNAQKQFAPGSIAVVTTLCNIARVQHVLGDIESCLETNFEIVSIAQTLTNGKKHPFVADRLSVLGNVLVEVGKLDDAMKVFADAARHGGENFTNSQFDVDGRVATIFSKVGLQHPGAATA